MTAVVCLLVFVVVFWICVAARHYNASTENAENWHACETRCDVLNAELIESQLEIDALQRRVDNQCESLTDDTQAVQRLRAELADAITSETAANRNADRLAQQMRQIHADSAPNQST
jgi:uncharacterized coiled-coil DUF342 family protein